MVREGGRQLFCARVGARHDDGCGLNALVLNGSRWSVADPNYSGSGEAWYGRPRLWGSSEVRYLRSSEVRRALRAWALRRAGHLGTLSERVICP